jgi:hypothetical protein
MNGHESVVTISPERQYEKPTATSSAPNRFSGRRSQASRPLPMKAAPMIGPTMVIRSRWWPPTLSIASASRTAQASAPASPIAASARRRLGEGVPPS